MRPTTTRRSPIWRGPANIITAIGYTTPYRWAHYVDAPFQPLRKPLGQSRVALVTTAAPFDPAKGDQGPGAKYNGGAKFYTVYDGDTSKPHDVRISHIAYDRVHTTADDSGTWFPLPQMLLLAREGRIGEVAPRFFGAPTNRSQRVTIETDAPEFSPAAGPTGSTPRCWCRTARSATRPSAWSRGIWRPTAFPPS